MRIPLEAHQRQKELRRVAVTARSRFSTQLFGLILVIVCWNASALSFTSSATRRTASNSPLFIRSNQFQRRSVPTTTTLPHSNKIVQLQHFMTSNDATTTSTTTPPPSPKSKSSLTLLERCDAWGLSLKPRVIQARDTATSLKDSNKKFKSILYTIKACAYITLFILYRAYRGFFVILPAVFKEVYRKMEMAVESPFEADTMAKQGMDSKEIETATATSSTTTSADINPKTGKVRARTTITVSLLASLVTFSYVVGGAWRVLAKFIRTTLRTSSVERSFEAAADQVMVNEGRIMKIANKDNLPQVNGEAVVNKKAELTQDLEKDEDDGEVKP